jgi:hypothetical protein
VGPLHGGGHNRGFRVGVAREGGVGPRHPRGSATRRDLRRIGRSSCVLARRPRMGVMSNPYGEPAEGPRRAYWKEWDVSGGGKNPS